MSHKKQLKLELIGEGVNTLKIEVYSHQGGINYANYKNEAKGVYLSFLPVNIEKQNGFVVESFAAFSGVKVLLEELNRLSQGKVDRHFAEVEKQIKGKSGEYWNMLAQWLDGNQLKLKE